MTGLTPIHLEFSGAGFIIYSPHAVSHIQPGEDYFASTFEDPDEVQRRAEDCSLVGVSTGTPGRFEFSFFEGYPDEKAFKWSNYSLRLGVLVQERLLCFRDLFDLMDWVPECPSEQTIELADGYHHLTLLSRRPPSGVLGDDQEVRVYLQPLDAKPALRYNGVPTLC